MAYLTEKQVFKLLNRIGEAITKEFNGWPKIVKDLETGKTLVTMFKEDESSIGVHTDDKCKLPKKLKGYEEPVEKYEETGDVCVKLYNYVYFLLQTVFLLDLDISMPL